MLTVIFLCIIKKCALLNPDYGGALLSWHCVFFFFGYWLRALKLSDKHLIILSFIGMLIWFILVPTWSRIKLPDYVVQVSAYTNQHSFEIIAGIYNYIVAFSGIGFAIILSIVMSKIPKARNILSLIGIHTVEMYLLQNFFFNLIITPFMWINIIFNIILGIAIPLLICFIFHSNRVSLILFGKKI